MKKIIKKILQERNLYYHLKYSIFFRLYQYIFKPGVIISEKKEIAFYKFFLPASGLIFDIGAYDGHKTEAFLKIAKKVVSCEPAEKNFTILKSRFRSKRKRVMLEDKALGAQRLKRFTLFIIPGRHSITKRNMEGNAGKG